MVPAASSTAPPDEVGSIKNTLFGVIRVSLTTVDVVAATGVNSTAALILPRRILLIRASNWRMAPGPSWSPMEKPKKGLRANGP